MITRIVIGFISFEALLFLVCVLFSSAKVENAIAAFSLTNGVIIFLGAVAVSIAGILYAFTGSLKG